MVRFRKGWLVAVVSIIGLGAAACKKKDDARNAVPGANPLSAALGSTGATGDDLALLPADAEVVFGMNLAQLQQSALWKEYGPKLKEKMSEELAEAKEDCGFDPFDAIKSVAFGMTGMDGDEPAGVFIIRGPNKASAMACAAKLHGKAEKHGSKLTVDGDVVMVKNDGGTDTAITFVNDTTMLGVVGAQATKQGVMAAAKGGKTTLKSSTTFMEMFGKIKPSQSLWLLINGNARALSKAGAMGVKPKAVFGSVNLTDGLAVDMRVRLGTPDEVNQLVTMAKGQIGNPQVKAMFDTLDVAADGNDAKLSVVLSNQKLKALAGMVGGMLGGAFAGALGGAGSP